MTIVDETVALWQAAQRDRDPAALRRCLAADVVFISPLTDAFRFRGPDQVCDVLESAWGVFEDVRWHTVVGDDATRALFFHATAAGEKVEEAQLLRFDGAGRVVEMTFYGRPLPGVTAVMTELAGPMMRRQGRPGMARLLRAATAPLAFVTKLGERRVVPLADPNRGKTRHPG